MNYNDIKLPPLPPLHIAPSVEPVDYPEVAQALIDYARAAIKADRQRRNKALQAECEKLRSIISYLKSWDCDVSGGFLSIPVHLRRRMQEAIDAALQEELNP